ncbi:hypothetical protein FNQ90_00890 [Streptomyces alkaliphilus]|uniref:Uncharacterized protein n=1 Tax=Streptomyces alkaliphilus TaxID=1472722 RepID=A0A7W3T9E7_9ACTN|nr:hypothetical protein [Streptomyces alkaliphilus]MBB0242699.1 hypothetical protein [Streptomyces alkaliphilus]
MTPDSARQHLRDTCTVLSCPVLIRLIGEIDDHGAIPARALTRTFADLPTHRVRQAVEQADALGLLTRTTAGLDLSSAGRDLADLYDATARWARGHQHPAPLCDYAGRIRHTFALLGTGAPHPRASDDERDVGLARIEQLMSRWIHAHRRSRDAYGITA